MTINGIVKTTRFSILILLIGASSTAGSNQEAVNGHYDPKNDWYVFEWVNRETGKQQTILDSANKVKPAMHATVSFNESTGVHTYAFQVTNLAGAVQLLDDISVKHHAAVFNATSPTPQNEWYSTEYSGKNAWSWSKIAGAIDGIPAGQTVSGFSFQSKGIPTIVGAWFTGKRREKFRFPSPDNETVEVQASFGRVYNSLKAQTPSRFINAVQQSTLGPVDPPADFVAMGFIQNMLTLEQQAVKLGWIANQGLSRSLVAKLEQAKKEVAACRVKMATNMINAFINEVHEARKLEEKERQKKDGNENEKNNTQITSEGHALLYFNGKYLLTQLKNKHQLPCGS